MYTIALEKVIIDDFDVLAWC